MAEENGNDAGASGGDRQQDTGARSGDADNAARPEYVPEQFWDSEAGAAKIEDLSRAYTDLSQRHGKGKEALRAEIEGDLTGELQAKLRPEIEAKLRGEMRAAAPATPMDYSLEFDGDHKKALDAAGLAILTEEPGADFAPEEGKEYFVVRNDEPLMKFFRQFAHKHGLPEAAFKEALIGYAQAEAAMKPTVEAFEAQREAVYKELGEHGRDRYDYARSRLEGVIGADKAKLLWPADATPSKAGVEAIEELLARAGEPSFSPGVHAVSGMSIEELRAAYRKLAAEPDYNRSEEMQRRAAEIFRRIDRIEKTGKAA
jgi:hypothetical protein